jgi:hypothetical protein
VTDDGEAETLAFEASVSELDDEDAIDDLDEDEVDDDDDDDG